MEGEKSGMTKFEYKFVLDIGVHENDECDHTEEDLNQLGREGWELVSAPVELTQFLYPSLTRHNLSIEKIFALEVVARESYVLKLFPDVLLHVGAVA